MEKRKWLWKKKSSEKSPGETESSESISSHSERYSDDQEAMKESPNDNSQSPEVTSKASVVDEEVNKSVKSLAEKLSAALVNVSAKEDLVKQHAKVAEEAVAGWEKAENELAVVKQQLDASVQKNVALEDRVSHLDGALKECVRQLRQSKDEQEKKINEAILEKTREWEITKLYLESQLLELNTQPESTETESPPIHPELHIKLESLEKENAVLKLELLSQSEELEIRTIERDLSIHAAETASKQHLESIKKVAKLETECRRLQAVARKPSLVNDRNARAGSITDSHSDSGDRLNECEPSLSDSWASALIAELDQFKNDQAVSRNSITHSFEVDVMDDFLEMERIAALPELESKKHAVESTNDEENALRTELETMVHKMAELEEKLKKVETEKLELENALTVSEDSLKASQIRLLDAEMRLEELQRELCLVSESKELLEFQLVTMEVEARTMSANVDLLKEGVEKERSLSAEMAARCLKLEDELMRKTEEVQLQQSESSKAELKIKQEDIAAASEKLAECQKTIASLGRQLNSLATLEDFLIDTANLPGFSGGRSPVPGADGELWKLHTNDTYTPKVDSEFSKVPGKTSCSSMNGNDGESLASSSSSSSSTSSSASLNRGSSSKSRNGFGKLFSRSKSGIQVENQQG